MSSAARGRGKVEKVVDNSKIVSRGQLRPAPGIRCMIYFLFGGSGWLINWINCFQGFALELTNLSLKSLIHQIIRSMAVCDGILTLHDT